MVNINATKTIVSETVTLKNCLNHAEFARNALKNIFENVSIQFLYFVVVKRASLGASKATTKRALKMRSRMAVPRHEVSS